ncbi:hypothetical protein [Actinacidiphila yanglinensis]|nr:hypothetical protein [Actinacidiphila yanglinensis]
MAAHPIETADPHDAAEASGADLADPADLSAWPPAVLDVGDVTASEARDAILRLLREGPARQEPFAALVDMSRTAAPTGEKDAKTADQARAIKELRPRLVARCRGLAFVIPAAPPAPAAPADAAEAGNRFWCCPVATVADRVQALARLRERLPA